MRRLATIGALALALALAVVVGAFTAASEGVSTGKVDVVFDDSRGLVPGQLVQVAGARVGKIDDVSVTDNYKARVHLEIENKFLPFSEDAQCTIKPQGLIAENYVQCDPGTPDAKPLKGKDGEPPTVPVEQTTQPVSLTDLFEVWNTPVSERLRVLFSMLGLATAGRGEDFNALLRRANPSLKLARKTIGILERQRRDLAETVDASSEIARAIARRPRDLERLIRHAGRVSVETASQRGALAQGVRELPLLLAEATPALQDINTTMDAAQPLLESIETASPDINRVSADIPKLAAAARPALRKLGPTLSAGARTAKRTLPVARVLRDYAKNSLPSAQRAGRLFPTLERQGFTRNLMSFFYNATLATSRFDDVSHILPAHITLSQCGMYVATPNPVCRGVGSTAATGPRAAEKQQAPERTRKPAASAPTPGTAPTPTAPTPAPAPGPAREPERSPAPLELPTKPLENLLELLLG